MGTRSVTKIKDDGETLLCIYRQYDGDYRGMGKDLFELISAGKLTNGITAPVNVFNGMGDLAAQLVAGLKKEPGNVYIFAADTEAEDCDAEYEYQVAALAASPNGLALQGRKVGTRDWYQLYPYPNPEMAKIMRRTSGG